jgi:signal transduction histidine kinase
LFNSIDEGFCLVEMLFDAAGKPHNYRFLEVNPAFEKHVGLLGAPGKTILELVPNIEQKWIDIYGQVAITGRSVRFRESSPSLRKSSFDVYAFRLGPEGSARVAVLFANVTQRVSVEDALKTSEQLALIGRMAGVISHEINNPLYAIQNLLYLAEIAKDPITALNYIHRAQQEVSSAARIVSQTLKFTRRAEDAREEKLSEIVDSALTLLEGKRKRSGISVELSYRAEEEVLCLSSELRQVFANFLSNAFDATPFGGRVAVRVRSSPRWDTASPECVLPWLTMDLA